ncbi:TPA: epoxyqueuosine reductase [Methanosarcina acetivorans]|uniref:Epoxyqueuosine reductase n=1 Tax=Methanosarcina acetivorans TaxID=2214 RepID=A0A832W867_9EURY|nr:hypothetical protein [Methanosarcina acetivorans]HIH95059.1 epoxyqueuosine reductase [Methanosarcina acetivorans]
MVEEYSSHLDERIRNFSESRSLYENLYPLAFPQKNVKWAKSIIVCVRRYGKYKIPEELDSYIGKTYLVDGRPKHSKEYFWRLEFDAYLGELGIKYASGIVTARLAAVNAGLGRTGKNNFFYTKEHGSWVFIETWVIDSEMEYDMPMRSLNYPDGCNKCIDSCPTGAMNMPLSMNRGKCIAQLTNGLNSQTEGLRAEMGTWIWV